MVDSEDLNANSDQGVSYFAAGPSKLPHEVLVEIQKELVEYGETRVSVVELSHRSHHFDRIIKRAEAAIRDLLDVPPGYRVMFVQGGGTGQFAAVAMNLIGRSGTADYVITGTWSSKAAKEAEKYGEVKRVVGPASPYCRVPPQSEWAPLNPDASYLYYCDNETVEGLEFDFVPTPPLGVPLVCDMSSNICSRPIDVSKFGVIFAGAQKNVGCAGVTLVVVREDLLGAALKTCPSMLDYKVMSDASSLLNTPPTFAVYVVDRVMAWLKRQGGVRAMDELAKRKSEAIYSVIDQSQGFYRNPHHNGRSRMNVIFTLKDPGLDSEFLEGAAKRQLLSLKGHRSVGGMRASLYNAVRLFDAQKLACFMEDFMLLHRQ